MDFDFSREATKRLTTVVREAFSLLRLKKGATLQVLTDYIKKDYKIGEDDIKKLVLDSLKAGVSSGLFIKIGDSYKVNYIQRVPVVIQKRKKPKKLTGVTKTTKKNQAAKKLGATKKFKKPQ